MAYDDPRSGRTAKLIELRELRMRMGTIARRHDG